MLAPYLAMLLSRFVAGAAAASLGHPGRAGWGTPRRAQRSARPTAQLDGKLDAQYRVAREPSRKIHQEVNQKIREFIISADDPEVIAIFGCLPLSPFPLPPPPSQLGIVAPVDRESHRRIPPQGSISPGERCKTGTELRRFVEFP